MRYHSNKSKESLNNLSVYSEEKLVQIFTDHGISSLYEQARLNWNLSQIYEDILEIKLQIFGGRKKLGAFIEKWFCCFLAGEYTTEKCVKTLNYESGMIYTSLSRYIYPLVNSLKNHNIRKHPNSLINYKDKEIKSTEDVLSYLFYANKNVNNQYLPLYRKQENNSREIQVISITFNAQYSQENIAEILKNMQEQFGVDKIQLNFAESGSLKSYWTVSPEIYQELKTWQQQGILSEKLGFDVLNINQMPSLEPHVNLTDWFQNVIVANWHSLESLLNQDSPNSTRQMALAISRSSDEFENNVSIQKAKIIDLNLQMNLQKLGLIIKIKQLENEENFDILVRVISLSSLYLPMGLKLVIDLFSEEAEATARNEDNIIQLGFQGNKGDEFEVKIILDNQIFREVFKI